MTPRIARKRPREIVIRMKRLVDVPGIWKVVKAPENLQKYIQHWR